MFSLLRLLTDTHLAYWVRYRGLKSIEIESTATFFGFGIDRLLNDERTNTPTTVETLKTLRKEGKKIGIKISDNLENKIGEAIEDNKTKKSTEKMGNTLLDPTRTNNYQPNPPRH